MDSLNNNFEMFFSFMNIAKNDFGPDKSLGDMFASLWKSDYIQSAIEFQEIQSSKDDIVADSFRKEGSKHYQNKDFPKALEFYNKSIIYSPYVLVKAATEPNAELFQNASKNLAFGFANRSAVLYELENYEACLTDVARAIKFGYPSLLKPKLIERQVKCFLALKMEEKAKSLLQNYLDEVNGLDEKESKLIESSTKKLKLLLSASPLQEEAVSKFKMSPDFQKQQMRCKVPISVAPELIETNPTIPSLSSAASISYSVEKGRHLVATRDILPGEILLKERSFVAALDQESLLTHCTFCLSRTFTPVPCPTCSYVVFCSEECADEALKLFHKTECPILPTVIHLKDSMGEDSCCFLRFVIRMTLEGLKKKIPLYDREKKEKPPISAGFDEKNIYKSDDFRQIYHLKTNAENRSYSDLVSKSYLTVHLVKLLLRTSYFEVSYRSGDDVPLEDLTLVGKTILTLMLNIPCNASNIYEYDTKSSQMHEIGHGAFGVFSLFNHSCNPSLLNIFHSSTLVSRSIQFIRAGSEITISYGPLYDLHKFEERQRKLKNYYFSCNCEACFGNWPLRDQKYGKLFLKCGNCNRKMNSPSDQCRSCKTDLSKTFFNGKSSKAIFNNIKLIGDRIQNLRSNNTSDEDDVNQLIKDLQQLQMYSSLPNQYFIDAQTRLKKCYLLKGSRY